MTTAIDRLIDRYLVVFRTPAADVDASFARWVIFGYFFYKLLSRDFSSFGTIPHFLLEVYPYDIYGTNHYMMMGVKYIVDISTFHWIHWIFPFPNTLTITLIQWAAILSCALTCLFGRGPARVFAVTTYVLLVYLWGFLFRSGGDIDAVFLGLSAALLYCCSSHEESLTVLRPRPSRRRTEAAGWMMSSILMCFVVYYFASGVNKFVDISIVDWFRFDIVQITSAELDSQRLGYHKHIPEIFELLRGQVWINYVGVPLVYLSHLLTPLMYFDRRLIPAFWLFYVMFHALSWGVGILFFGNFILWLAFLPVHRFAEPINVQWATGGWLTAKRVAILRALDSFSAISFTENNDLVARGRVVTTTPLSGETRTGLAALRRLTWSIPWLWPVLPALYLFDMFHLVSFFAKRRAAVHGAG